jgi:3-oxoacyl-[acyl-carrier protein] reductase
MRDRIALVTGGSRGIGRAIALRLKKEGAHVAFLYAGNGQAAQNTLEELKALGGKAMAIQCDISDLAQVQDAFARIKQEWGTVDILVNNAGITMDGLTPRMTQEAFDRVIQVNLNGAFYLIRTAYGDLLRKRWGRIVNISSVSGLMGNPGQANYSAAKAGLIGLTKTIAKELAARNITCNAVAPGFIETDMTEKMGSELVEKAVQAIPSKRMGTAEEIAAAVAFLCSDEAGYITGAVLQVDGGLYM